MSVLLPIFFAVAHFYLSRTPKSCIGTNTGGKNFMNIKKSNTPIWHLVLLLVRLVKRYFVPYPNLFQFNLIFQTIPLFTAKSQACPLSSDHLRPIKEPIIPRTICRPTVVPILRAAFLSNASVTLWRWCEPPDAAFFSLLSSCSSSFS